NIYLQTGGWGLTAVGTVNGGIAQSQALPLVVPCLSNPICATSMVVGTVGILGYEGYRLSKGGKQEVGHDYVRAKARDMGGDYCSALKTIMDTARRSGDSKLFNDAKATYKQDCRGK